MSNVIQCIHCKSKNTIKNGSGRISCRECRKSFYDPATEHGARVAAETQVSRLQKQVQQLTKEDNAITLMKRLIGTIDMKINRDVPAWAIRKPKAQAGAIIHGIPTLMLSDLHFGEVVFPSQVNNTNAFNTQIAKQRLKRVIEGSVKLLRETLAPGVFGGMVVILGGDMVEGTIHDELRDTVDETPMEAILTLHDELVKYLKLLCDEFGQLHIPCVVGNHGRMDRKPRMKNGPKLNYDWVLYQFVARSIGLDPSYKDRITFQIPDGFECLYRIHNVRYMLTHGDSFKGGDGISGPLMPWKRGMLKSNKAYSAMGLPFDVMVMGHWHQLRYLKDIIVNGSLVGYNEYAQKMHFDYEVPQQALWLTHPDRGLTFQEAVFADDVKTGSGPREWVSVYDQNVKGIKPSKKK